MNYQAGLQASMIDVRDLNSIYQGRMSEQAVGQELIARNLLKLQPPVFWVREKPGSQAELDFLYIFRNKLIPIEVKSGKTGTLRSLFQFISSGKSDTAIRLYSGKYSIDSLHTPDNITCRLINLPYYLAGKISKYLELV